ncbi:MAG: hypothetical protein HKN15_13425 [Xanthomonadales bacterium]|nr:hypothetical protein [Xanthomonadales bacterium]
MADRQFSAFGSTEPLFDPKGDRIRWCCPEFVDDAGKLTRILETARHAGASSGVSRISLRAFSDIDLAEHFRRLIVGSGFRIEAVIDPGRTDGCRMTYLGWCGPGRQDHDTDAEAERLLVKSVTSQRMPEIHELQQEVDAQEVFDLVDYTGKPFAPSDAADLVAMHRQNFPRFPYDFEQKLDILRQQPETYLQVVLRSRLDGKIHAFSNLELNTVRLSDGRAFVLAEYDNTMKRTDARKDHPTVDGTGRMVRLQLARLAAARGVDFCYSESRSSLVAINRISYQIGMHYGGKLLKHLLISGETDIEYRAPSRFESMNIWFFETGRLASLIQAALSQPCQ